MGTRRLFAVDLGASGGKCFAGIIEDGRLNMSEVHRFPHEGVTYYVPDRTGKVSERAHWDDTLIYQNIIEGLQNYGRDVSGELDSIGIDTWGSDGHFLSNDGDMLGKMYCYRDHRLDNMVEIIKSKIDTKRIYGITGIHFQPFNISNQLVWFLSERGNLMGEGSFFLPVPSLFYYYLGGVRKVDSSWASVTQLMDAKTKEWSGEVLGKLGIPTEIMPEIVAPGEVIGQLYQEIADSAGINPAKLIAVAAHDTASAFASAPVEDSETALIISSGTWSLVGKLVPEPITTDAAMDYNISNEGGIGNIRCLKNCMGTWLVQELRRVWRIADGREMDWDEITDLAAKAEPFVSLIDPDDPGFYNPSNMEEAIAEFCRKTGQPVPAGRRAYLRTVYESLALKYRMVNEQVCSVSGTQSSVVNIVGGGSKNEMLNQFTADALDMPVMAGPEEATAIGNLMVQAMGLGVIGSMAEALPIIKESFHIREYQPKDTAGWQEAYETMKKIAI